MKESREELEQEYFEITAEDYANTIERLEALHNQHNNLIQSLEELKYNIEVVRIGHGIDRGVDVIDHELIKDLINEYKLDIKQ